MDPVKIRSGEVSAKLLYNETYFDLTQASATVESTDSTERATKPIWKQLSDFLKKGDTHAMEMAAEKDAHEIAVRLPTSTERLSDRISATLPILLYTVLEHVVKDLQLQLSYMLARGVSVHRISDDDVYAVEVEPEHWRYVLLTENTSLKGGSTAAFLTFLREHVGPQYLGTKLFAYVNRLEVDRQAEWI
jgi:hypothetical protein